MIRMTPKILSILTALAAATSSVAFAQSPADAPAAAPTSKPAARSPLFKRTKFDARLESMRGKLKLETSERRVRPNPKQTTRPLVRARTRQAVRRTAIAAYQKQHRELIQALLNKIFVGRPLDAAAQKALRASAEKNAKLDRIEDMAITQRDEATIERIEQLRQVERQRLTQALHAAARTNQR